MLLTKVTYARSSYLIWFRVLSLDFAVDLKSTYLIELLGDCGMV